MAKAVMSDIHGNLPALETALRIIEGMGIEEIVCLGDVWGYGGQGHECHKLIAQHPYVKHWVLGNHDDMMRLKLQFGKDAKLPGNNDKQAIESIERAYDLLTAQTKLTDVSFRETIEQIAANSQVELPGRLRRMQESGLRKMAINVIKETMKSHEAAEYFNTQLQRAQQRQENEERLREASTVKQQLEGLECMYKDGTHIYVHSTVTDPTGRQYTVDGAQQERFNLPPGMFVTVSRSIQWLEQKHPGITHLFVGHLHDAKISAYFGRPKVVNPGAIDGGRITGEPTFATVEDDGKVRIHKFTYRGRK